jgi:hypothetical protein
MATVLDYMLDFDAKEARNRLQNAASQGQRLKNVYQRYQNQFAPEQMEASLDYKRAQTPYIEAMTNALLHPRIQVSSQLNTFNQLLSAYNEAPEGSQRKNALGAMLNNLTAQKKGVNVSASPTGVSVDVGGSSQPNQLFSTGAIQKPQNGSRSVIVTSPSRGQRTVYTVGSDGKIYASSAPTMAAMTATQKRQQAESEGAIFTKYLDMAFAPYSGALGAARFVRDVNSSDPQIHDRAIRFMVANHLKTEALANQGRLAGFGDLGAEVVKMLESRYPNIPSEGWEKLTSAKDRLLASIMATALNLKGAHAAINRAAEQFTTNINRKELPSYIRGRLPDTGISNRDGEEDFIKRAEEDRRRRMRRYK